MRQQFPWLVDAFLLISALLVSNCLYFIVIHLIVKEAKYIKKHFFFTFRHAVFYKPSYYTINKFTPCYHSFVLDFVHN